MKRFIQVAFLNPNSEQSSHFKIKTKQVQNFNYLYFNRRWQEILNGFLADEEKALGNMCVSTEGCLEYHEEKRVSNGGILKKIGTKRTLRIQISAK